MLLMVAGFACAERFLFTPTGGKYRADRVRFETLLERGSTGDRFSWAGVGIGQAFDLEITETRLRRGASYAGIDFGYNFALPFPDIAPGISFGVQDVANQTPAGRSLYGAVTWRYNQFDPWNSQTPLEFTLGGGTGRYRGIFLSTRLPLADVFRIVVEHDSREVAFGTEIIPFQGARALWMVRAQRAYLGLGLSLRL